MEQMRKLKHRGVSDLAQGHTVSRWQSQYWTQTEGTRAVVFITDLWESPAGVTPSRSFSPVREASVFSHWLWNRSPEGQGPHSQFQKEMHRRVCCSVPGPLSPSVPRFFTSFSLTFTHALFLDSFVKMEKLYKK